MPGRAADRDDGLQDPAGALGQGTDPDLEEDPAASLHAAMSPFHIKIEAFYHLTANISYPLMIVLSVLLMPAMIIRFYQGWFQMLLIDLPLFMASTFSISSFYLVSQKELFPRTLAQDLSLSAVSHGAGHRPDPHQHEGRDGSAVRHQERFQADAEISRAIERRESRRRRNTASAWALCPGSSCSSAATLP